MNVTIQLIHRNMLESRRVEFAYMDVRKGREQERKLYSTKELRARQPGWNEFRPTSYLPMRARAAGWVGDWLWMNKPF